MTFRFYLQFHNTKSNKNFGKYYFFSHILILILLSLFSFAFVFYKQDSVSNLQNVYSTNKLIQTVKNHVYFERFKQFLQRADCRLESAEKYFKSAINTYKVQIPSFQSSKCLFQCSKVYNKLGAIQSCQSVNSPF